MLSPLGDRQTTKRCLAAPCGGGLALTALVGPIVRCEQFETRERGGLCGSNLWEQKRCE